MGVAYQYSVPIIARQPASYDVQNPHIRSTRQPSSYQHRSPSIVNVQEPNISCLLYTSPSPRDGLLSRMPSSA